MSTAPPSPERPRWAQGEHDDIAQAPDVAINDDLALEAITNALLAREILSAGFRFTRSASWQTSADGLDHLDALTFHGEYGHGHDFEALVQGDDYVARLFLRFGRVNVYAAASSRDRLVMLYDELRAALPQREADPEVPRVPVTFWSLSPQGGASARTREIDVPPWEDVAEHYVEATRRHLEPLMTEDFQPGSGGQLILWHGPPGTGKTYALRALLWEWREWCSPHYIVDPETFFGESASYLLDVLLHDEDGPQPVVAGSDVIDEDEEDSRAADGRWRLLVLEDTGEMMSADARQRAGQGLSRLLNVVDGMLGQGLRVLVLVTTNEEIRKLHEAVARPGRCASKVLFGGLPVDEARAWLEARDVEPPQDLEGVQTIADLFAIAEERRPELAERGVGFA